MFRTESNVTIKSIEIITCICRRRGEKDKTLGAAISKSSYDQTVKAPPSCVSEKEMRLKRQSMYVIIPPWVIGLLALALAFGPVHVPDGGSSYAQNCNAWPTEVTGPCPCATLSCWWSRDGYSAVRYLLLLCFHGIFYH